MQKLSRAEKRLQKQHKKSDDNTNKSVYSLKLREISPKTTNQERVFKDFTNGKNLLIHGLPGTGKSFISLYLALREIEQFKSYQNITIIRSVVPSRDMGFLPGSIIEKSRIYEMPYEAICIELYGRGDAYGILKNKNIIDFQTSSFLRGIMTYQELSTIITRVGSNSKIIFCGDYRQTDLKYDNERSGVLYFMKILGTMNKYFSCIEFDEEDIVRSGLVKDFIIKKSRFDYDSFLKAELRETSFTQSEVVQPH